MLWQKQELDFPTEWTEEHVQSCSVENLFGYIRAHGFRNTNLSCKQFTSLLKTTALNGFMSPQSQFMNCEKDNSNCFNTFEVCLETKKCRTKWNWDSDRYDISGNRTISKFISKKLLKHLKIFMCKAELTTLIESEIHSIIRATNYSCHALCLLSTYVCFLSL